MPDVERDAQSANHPGPAGRLPLVGGTACNCCLGAPVGRSADFMYLISNDDVTDPALNLAVEEHCLLGLNPRIEGFLFYSNDSAVIIGRNQNPLEEVDLPFARQQGIAVVRRISGGGAVYHDRGNLNFSFITRARRDRTAHYRRMTRPIRDCLRRLGVPVDWNARNDLVADGEKLSGNAHYIASGRMLSHGTLLVDADLEVLSSALAGTVVPTASKALSSVRAPVANVGTFLPTPITTAELRRLLIEAVSASVGGVTPYRLGRTDWQAVHRLAEAKYRRWEWTMGRTPEFVLRVVLPIADGRLGVTLRVNRGVVQAVMVDGGSRTEAVLRSALEGARFEEDRLARRLSGTPSAILGISSARQSARRLLGWVGGTGASVREDR